MADNEDRQNMQKEMVDVLRGIHELLEKSNDESEALRAEVIVLRQIIEDMGSNGGLA